MTKKVASAFFLLAAVGAAGEPGGQAKCVGGTLASVPPGATGTVYTARPDAFVFATKKSTVSIPYQKVNLLEYSQDAGRRVVLAVAVSPLFLLSKARAHYVTVGYSDPDGRQQAMVLRVDKHLIRAMLATLEARTGRSVKCLDEEARKFYHN